MNLFRKIIMTGVIISLLSMPVYAEKNDKDYDRDREHNRNSSKHKKDYPESDMEVIETEATPMNAEETVMSVSSDLGITSQIKINGVNVGENGLRIIDNANMTCNFGVSNSSDTKSNINVLIATYTQTGRLYNISTYETDIEGGQTKNIEIIYQFDAENEATAKLMIWNSLSVMIPVRATVDFSQTSGINAYYYNSDNRLLQIDKMNGKSLIFTYDNMGNLLTKTIRE